MNLKDIKEVFFNSNLNERRKNASGGELKNQLIKIQRKTWFFVYLYRREILEYIIRDNMENKNYMYSFLYLKYPKLFSRDIKIR